MSRATEAYQRILVGIDDSRGGRAAVTRAIQLAADHEAMLYAVVVEEQSTPLPAAMGTIEHAPEETRIKTAELVGRAKKLAAQGTVRLSHEVHQGDPASIIVERAHQLDCDLIILGHAKRDRGDSVGSTAARIANHAHCDVLVVHRAPSST